MKRTKKLWNRAKRSRLYLIETTQWALGNTSSLTEILTTAVQTVGCTVSGKNAATDLGNAFIDYSCSDYKCLILDTAATFCDITGMVTSFLPGPTSKKVFGVASGTSSFCRTLRNKCKAENIFGCN
jgi:hypothetical protein